CHALSVRYVRRVGGPGRNGTQPAEAEVHSEDDGQQRSLLVLRAGLVHLARHPRSHAAAEQRGDPRSTDDNNNEIGGIFYLDLNLSWQVPVQGDLSVYGEVNNALDRAPPQTPAAYGRTGSAEWNYQLYDWIGRRYTLGVRYKF